MSYRRGLANCPRPPRFARQAYADSSQAAAAAPSSSAAASSATSSSPASSASSFSAASSASSSSSSAPRPDPSVRASQLPVRVLQQRAAGSDVAAMRELAARYAMGWVGFAKNIAKASAIFTELADFHDDDYSRGKLLALCKGELAEAFRFYTRAAEQQGLAIAQHQLGNCAEQGWGCPQNNAQALAFYKQAAAAGFTHSLFRLGMIYRDTHGICGVQKDFEASLNWFQRAAELGHADAVNELGLAHEHGRGIKPDHQKAFLHYLQAAEMGSGIGQFNVANCYFVPKCGQAKDLAKAARWYAQAAKHEEALPEASALLSEMYEDGVGGLSKNETKAFELCYRAAQHGLLSAQQRIAYAFCTGTLSRETDYCKAFEWYGQAAHQGNGGSMHNLGYILLQGMELGMELDEMMARLWLSKASAKGDNNARRIMSHLQ